MTFIAFEMHSISFFPTIYVEGEAGAVYPFTTKFQTSIPHAYKNALILMLQKA